MKVAILQCDTRKGQVEENILRYSDMIAGLDAANDLIVLPEMFLTGFTADIVEAKWQKRGLEFMLDAAKSSHSALCGSLLVGEGGKYYNRLYFVQPDGKIDFYDKRHLFPLSLEAQNLTAGLRAQIVSYKGWRINLITCYDLRFGSSFHNVARNGILEYDLLICVASFPDVRIRVWDTLLVARAIENQSYVLGCNRCGMDEQGLIYSGHSCVVDFKGEVLLRANDKKEEATCITLQRKPLLDFRNAFPVWKDWD